MLSDEYPEMNVLSSETIGGSPVGIHLYVEDVDAVVKNDPSVRRRGGLRRQDNNVRAWAKAVRGTELPGDGLRHRTLLARLRTANPPTGRGAAQDRKSVV